VIALAALLVVLAAPLEGFVAPLALPTWLDAAFPLSWLLLLGFGAWRAFHGSPRRGPV
jgi:hypothetical protein